MARILAEEQLAGRLRISPRSVMCASEVLTDDSRKRIHRAWNCRPFDVYAATETAGIASECSLHRMHLFEDLVITEVVDEKNRSVPAGQPGAKLLVTVLFSRTQPLIRYEMSDRVTRSDAKCNCGIGFALLVAIDGRTEDILELPARFVGSVRVHPNVFHLILDRLPVQAWQVLAESDGIHVLLARPDGAINMDMIASEIERAIEQQGAERPIVRVEVVEEVTKTVLGKSPLIRGRTTNQDA
jgi:phenylacetate-coenzyme A ligase PaaK-like adenylate-forming protein